MIDPVATAIADIARVLIDRIAALGRAAREDDDPPSGKAALDDMGDALGLGRSIEPVIGLLGILLFDMLGRQLDLDDMRAEQRRHVRGISADVERQLARFGQLAAARV